MIKTDILNYLAHAGEVHDDVAEVATHLFESNLVAIPSFVFATILIGVAAYYLSKKSITTVIHVLLVYFLAVSLLGFAFAPAAGMVAIICGFTLALGSVLFNLKN